MFKAYNSIIKKNYKYNTMKQENLDKELQSRRSFFKEAAMRTLPVIGLFTMVNLPIWGTERLAATE